MAMKDSLNMDALAKQVESVIVDEVTKGFSQARKEIEARAAKETINIDGINVKADGIYKETVDALEKQKVNIEKAIKKVNKELSSIQPITSQASKLQQRYKTVDVSLSKEETKAIQESVVALQRKTNEEDKAYKGRQQQLEKQLTQIAKLQKFESALAPQVRAFAITDDTSVEQLREYVKMANDLVSIRKRLGDSKAQLDFDPGKRLSQLNQNMTSWVSKVAGDNGLKRIAEEEAKAVTDLKGRISGSGVFNISEEIKEDVSSVDLMTKALNELGEEYKNVSKYAVDAETAFSKLKELETKRKRDYGLSPDDMKDYVGYGSRLAAIDTDYQYELTPDMTDWMAQYTKKYREMSTQIYDMTMDQIDAFERLSNAAKESDNSDGTKSSKNVEELRQEIESAKEDITSLMSRVDALEDADGFEKLQGQVQELDKMLKMLSDVTMTNVQKAVVQMYDGINNVFEQNNGNKISGYWDVLKSQIEGSGSELERLVKLVGLWNSEQNGLKVVNDGMVKSGGFIGDDITVLASKNKNGGFAETQELKKKLDEAYESGVNVARILDVIGNEESKVFLEIQETAKGDILGSVYGQNDNPFVNPEIFEATDAQIKKLIEDLITLNKLGIGVDINASNIFYDKIKGFQFIDLDLSPAKYKNAEEFKEDMFGGILGGIEEFYEDANDKLGQDKTAQLRQKFEQLSDIVQSAYADAQDSHSPSKAFEKLEGDAVDGVVVGEYQNEDKLKNVGRKMAEAVKDGYNEEISDGFESPISSGQNSAIEETTLNLKKLMNSTDEAKQEYIQFLAMLKSNVGRFEGSLGLNDGLFGTDSELFSQLSKINPEFSKATDGDEFKVTASFVLELAKALGIADDNVKNLEGSLEMMSDYGDQKYYETFGFKQITDSKNALVELIEQMEKYNLVTSEKYGKSPWQKEKESYTSAPAVETAVSNPENFERENAAIAENTQELDKNTQARQENQAQQKIGGNDPIARAMEEEGQTVDEVVSKEQLALQRLQETLRETALAVDTKTNAFREEQQTVDGIVQEEITRLEVLSGTLLSLASDLEKFTNVPVNIKVEDSGLSEENLDRIKTSLTTIKEQIGDSITLDVKFDEQSLIDFTSKSDGLVNNLNKIVEDLKEVQTTISSINPDVLKAVAKLPAHKKGEIGVGATKEDNAKDANKRRGAEASDDVGWSQAEYDDRTALIELETAKLHELIETEGGVVKSTTEFRDSLGNLIKTQVKGEQEIDGATVKTTYTTGYKRERKLEGGDVIPSEAFYSSISSDDYAKAEKTVTNALQEQEKAIQRIVELRAKMHSLDPESDKDNIALLRSQIKEQQGIVEKNDRIINQNKEVVTQEERIKNSLDAREKAVLKVAATEETARKKAEEKASRASSKTNESKVSKPDEVLNAYKELSVLIPKIQKLEQQRDSGKKYDVSELEKLLHQQERYKGVLSNVTVLTEAQSKAYKEYSLAVEDAEIKQKAFNEQLSKSNKANFQLNEIGMSLSQARNIANKSDGLVLTKATDDFRDKMVKARIELVSCIQYMEQLQAGEPITQEQLDRTKAAVAEVKQLNSDWNDPTKGSKVASKNHFSKLYKNAIEYKTKITGASKEVREELDNLIARIEKMGRVGSTTDLSKLGTELNDFESKVKSAGQETKSFFNMFTSRVKGMSASALAQYFSLYDIIRYTKQAAQTVKEYDTALTEMRKVSDESVESLKNYQKSSFGVADAVGTTAKQIQNSTADWLRLGETFEEAKESAKDATILLNVSEFNSIDEATQSLVSASQAFKNLDKMEIIDVLNNIGNNFSVSTDQLAQGLQNAAAVLQTQGNDLNQSVALLTAGNAITQDMSKTSAGIRTISLRISGTEEAKQELSDLGEDVEDFIVQTRSKTDQLIRDYTAVASNDGKGVSVLDNNGNLRDTYSILLDISKIYKEIQEEDKKYGTNRSNALVEALAGKNRSNIAASILQNPEMLENVYNAAQNSTGSAQEELDKYLDSIDGRIAKFKNQLQELAVDFINSDTVKKVVDFGTNIIDIIDSIISKLGSIPTVLGAITGILMSKNGVGKIIKSARPLKIA